MIDYTIHKCRKVIILKFDLLSYIQMIYLYYQFVLFITYTRSLYFFFFSSRRRHTRYWRDWSSDVCSSDLDYLQVSDAAHRELVGWLRAHRKEVWVATLQEALDWARTHPSRPGRPAGSAP